MTTIVTLPQSYFSWECIFRIEAKNNWQKVYLIGQFQFPESKRDSSTNKTFMRQIWYLTSRTFETIRYLQKLQKSRLFFELFVCRNLGELCKTCCRELSVNAKKIFPLKFAGQSAEKLKSSEDCKNGLIISK